MSIFQWINYGIVCKCEFFFKFKYDGEQVRNVTFLCFFCLFAKLKESIGQSYYKIRNYR